MTTGTWVVSSAYPINLELMMAWLPEKPWPWLRRAVVLVGLSHAQEPELFAQLEAITKQRPAWPFEVHDDLGLQEAAKTISPDLARYSRMSLGFKITAPLRYGWDDDFMLFTDDDMVITDDPAQHGLPYYSMWSHTGLDKAHASDPVIKHIQSFDPTFSLDEFNELRCDGGVWSVHHDDMAAYQDAVRIFFSDALPNMSRSLYRLIDQRFLTWFFIQRARLDRLAARDQHLLTGANGAYRICPTKYVPKRFRVHKTFMHYCASGVKQPWRELMWKEVEEQGKPKFDSWYRPRSKEQETV